MSTLMNPKLSEQRVENILEKEYKPSDEPLDLDRVAIIVNHGMGQQVPFETLELVAEAVWRACTTPLSGPQPQLPGEPSAPFITGAQAGPARPEIRSVRLGTEDKDIETEITRVEMTFTDKAGVTHDVHFYEAYWAPLTEGKVRIRDVVGFLGQTGWDGLRNSGVGTCKRWMFGDWQRFRLRALKQCGLYLYVVVLVGSLFILNAVIAAAAAARAIGGSGNFPGKHLNALTSDFLIADLVGFLIFLATFGVPRMYTFVSNKKISPRPLVWLEWLLMIPGVVTLPFLGYLMFWQLNGGAPEVRLWPWVLPLATRLGGHPVFTSIFWGLVILGAAGVRRVLIEYGGDVVAYVAAHTVSKFWDLRKQIWDTAMKVARAVYRAQDAGGNFYYPHVVVLGHSLGSVIAYDVLNGLLLEDGFSAKPLDVAGRTRLLITFGSPLDKTAFVFRTQADADSEIREVTAAAVQPMIADYKFRPKEWVNIFSNADIFADPLKYYDEDQVHESSEYKHQRVWNLRDSEARTPLVAHTEYWHGDLLATQLYRGITTRPPA